MSLLNQLEKSAPNPKRGWHWFLAAVALGAFLGFLFNVFVDKDQDVIFEVGWDILKILTAFVFFLFGLKLVELFKITGDQQRTTAELAAIREVTVALAKASTHLSIAREEQRQGNLHAAVSIIETISEVLAKAKSAAFGFDELLSAIDRERFAVLDLRAICLFDRVIDSRAKGLPVKDDLTSLRATAAQLTTIDADSWRANHWQGVAFLLQLEKNEPDKWQHFCSEARPFLEASLRKQQDGNRDAINLCECYFVLHQFSAVREQARRFLFLLDPAAIEPQQKGDVLALFFWTIGEYVCTGNEQLLDTFQTKSALARSRIAPDRFYSGNVVKAVIRHIEDQHVNVEHLNSDPRRARLRQIVEDFCSWAES